MISKLSSKEEVNATLVLALSGALMMLVTMVDGPLWFERVVARVLSNPVPKEAVGTSHSSYVPAPPRQQQVAA
jgi:hypothetical protein